MFTCARHFVCLQPQKPQPAKADRSYKRQGEGEGTVSTFSLQVYPVPAAILVQDLMRSPTASALTTAPALGDRK